MTNHPMYRETDTPMVRVLVVEDDPLARTGLSLIVDGADDLQIVGQGGMGEQARVLAVAHTPDVVLLNMRGCWTEGLATVAALCGLPRPPAVLVLAGLGHDDHLVDALAAGAKGLLPAESSPQEICDAVRVVAGGEAMLAPRCATAVVRHVAQSRRSARRHQAAMRMRALSEREREVVAAVAQGKPNAEIALELYLSEATVKTHITRMFAKLDVTNRVQLAILAYEAGVLGRAELSRAPPLWSFRWATRRRTAFRLPRHLRIGIGISRVLVYQFLA